jgi:pimeloyl-ACP methyl ester carboxylesterase
MAHRAPAAPTGHDLARPNGPKGCAVSDPDRSPGLDDERDLPSVTTPLESLGIMAVQSKAITDDLDHVELFSPKGLLTLLWHGPRDAHDVVLLCGGALGGLLGPADGLYHDLGTVFAQIGIGTIRVGYRRANDLDACIVDTVAAAELAGRSGASSFVTVGHSFGGAVAINAAVTLSSHAAGVVTLATQSAGCEQADLLGDTPLLLLHGDRDEILPVSSSQVVRMIAGSGELVVFPGTGHLFTQVDHELRERLVRWIPQRFVTD